jgi:hypothetical protein
MKKNAVSRLVGGFFGAVAALSLLSGCGERESAGNHGQSHAEGEAHDHDAEPATPHGGTPVMIAEEKFHLELVLTCNDTRYIVWFGAWQEMRPQLLVVPKTGRSWSGWPAVELSLGK